MNFTNKQILILGLGDTGLSMALYLSNQGAKIRVADSRKEPPMANLLQEKLPTAVLHTGPFRTESFKDIDIIAISPGIDKRDPLISKAVNNGIPLVGDIELFALAINKMPASDRPLIIGITGSNGKSTVTMLTGKMCKQAGKKTVIAGNIGLPVLSALMDSQLNGAPDVYVLELSSFQLETTSSLHLDAATVLNVSEDHLDRYTGISTYAIAKARIFMHAKTKVVNRDDAHTLAMVKKDKSFRSFGLKSPVDEYEFGLIGSGNQCSLAEGTEALMAVSEMSIAGLHNATNALAALALARAIHLPYPPLLEAVKAFKGLPHRVEKIAEIDGVIYYDDSKGTNVGATLAALSGLGSPVVLIAGGDGKGQDFSPLKDAVGKQARAVVLIGHDAPLIDSAICASQVSIEHAVTLEEAVHRAALIAQPGDAVLLSPACASFDMFKNYVHRAEVFINAVMELQNKRKGQNVL